MDNQTTTDNLDELYDVVTEDDQVVGIATRREVHQNPALIHRASGLLLMDDTFRILLQKRSMTKDMAPGKWMISVGGHVDSGDTYEEAIQREVTEELGIHIKQYWPVTKKLVRNEGESEFHMLYLSFYIGPIENWNRVEADAVQWFSFDEIEKGAADGSLDIIGSAWTNIQIVKEKVFDGTIQKWFAEWKGNV